MFLLQYLPLSHMVIAGYSVHSYRRHHYLYPRLLVLNQALIKIGAAFHITHPITPDGLNSMGHSLLFSQISITAVLFHTGDLRK